MAAMNPRIRLVLLSLLLALMLPACQSLSERDDARKLQETLDSYASTVRWQPLDRMYSYLTPELQPEVMPDGLDRWRVTGYEIYSPPRMLAKDRVVQTVVIEFIQVDRQVVRNLTDQQLWIHVDDKWQRANPIPAFE
jgi:hypothetical protein